jgi:alpha-glucosidase
VAARFLALALLAGFGLAGFAAGQDERRVTSPNGEIDVRLFIAEQQNTTLSRIAYQVDYKGQRLLNTSFMGLDIWNQEPLLGENDGLTSSSSAKHPLCNSMIVRYMQNGSLGRLIEVEVRAYNDGVAFRYVIPPSTPLMEILVAEEATEFRFTEKVGTDAVLHVGPAWVKIGESKQGSYPPMHLAHFDSTTLITRLARPFEGNAPLTCPWRTIAIGSSRESVQKSAMVADLN